MTDPKDPFAAMLQIGQDWAKAMAPAMEHLTPKGFEALWPTMPKEAMEAMMGKGISPDGLDAKTRLLLTLAGLAVLGAQAEAQIRLTVRHVLAAGATKQEITETIGMMGLFGGIPAMTKALELATAVMEEDPK